MLKALLKPFQLRLCALVALILCAGGTAWGESFTKTEGFESKAAGTNYQSTVTVSEDESDCGIGWEIYYGTVSTSSKISDSKSAALRLYTTNNYGYLKTTTPIDGLQSVAFQVKASTSNGAQININVDYSTDGSTWNTIESYVPGSSASVHTHDIPAGGKYVRIAINPNSKKPSSNNAQLTIDDVVFTYDGTATPTVAAPVISGNESFLESTEVSITCSTEGAAIQYSTDGTNWTAYSAPFTISEMTTVQAKATKDGMDDSGVASKTFTKATIITVAEAIETTPASGTSANMYIRGKVSAFYNTSIVGDGSNYRYYISDDGTTTNQLLVYKGKGLNEATFTDINDLLVGDEVVIYGALTTYQNDPEVASGNYIVSLTRPEVAVVNPTFSPAAGTFYESQTVTLACETEGATIKYSFDNSTWNDYTTALTIDETTTIYAKAVKGSDESAVEEATYTIKDPDAKGGPSNPYTVAEALAAPIQENAYVSGIICSFPSGGGVNVNQGTASYNISDDGENSNYITIYKGKNLDNEPFTATNQIAQGDEVVVCGNIIDYNGVNEFGAGNYLVSRVHHARTYAVNWTDTDDITLFVFDADDQTTPLASGDGIEDGKTVLISPDLRQYYIIDNISAKYTDAATGVRLTEGTDGTYTFTMPAAAVTITATAKDGRQDLEFHFASFLDDWSGTYNVTSQEQLEKPVLMINNGAEINTENIVYSSNNESVATVDASTGDVTLLAQGTAVITASYPGDETYKPWADSYTIVYGDAPASEFTWDLSTNSYVANPAPTDNLISWSSDYATMTNEKGTSGTAVNNYIPTARSSTRMYKGNLLTITPADGYKITSLTFTATSNDYAAAFANSTWTNATTTVSSTTVTVIPTNGVEAIRATIGGTCGFTGVKVSYVANDMPTISIASPLEVGSNEASGTLAVSYLNIADNSAAELVLCDAAGAPATYDWLLAELDADKNIEYVVAENNVEAARTAYLQVKVGDVESNIVTITQAAFVIDFATLPFVYDGNGAMIGYEAGVTPDKLEAYSASPAIKFGKDGANFILKIRERPGILTFDIKANPSNDVWEGTFRVQTSTDGATFTDVATYTEISTEVESKTINNLPVDARYIKFIYEKTTGNVALGNIVLDVYRKPYAVLSADKKTVTFYYDNNKSENTGDGTAYDITDGTTEYTNWAGSYANNSVKPGTITKAVFTEAFKKYDGLTSLDNWFNYCERLTEIEGIENLNTANVTTMRNMFNHCLVLTSLDLSSFNTSSVTDMYDMFSQCRALTSIDLSSFNTENVTNMSYMFSYCQALQTLDLSSFNTSNVSNMKWMFATMPELTTIYVSDLWSNAATNLNNSESMFYGCSKLVGGAGTAYSTSLHNYSYNTYAIIDGTDGKPGYFTDIAVKPVSVTIGASGYATFVAPKAVSFPGAVEAFIVTEVKESSVHLEAVSAAVPAGTPLVLRAAQGTYELPITESADEVTGNLLQASDGNVTGNGSIYALGVGKEGDATGKVGFFPVTSGAKVPAGKAYLSTANGVKAFLGFDFDLPTSVDEMKNEESRMKNSEIFDLSGRRVAKAQKGVYIVNGRKVAIK